MILLTFQLKQNCLRYIQRIDFSRVSYHCCENHIQILAEHLYSLWHTQRNQTDALASTAVVVNLLPKGGKKKNERGVWSSK